MFLQRAICVLCESSLSPFFSLQKFPLNSHPTHLSADTDVFCDYEYGICTLCKCVQLTTLVDPSFLYSSDNKHGLTPLWNEHHRQFSDFIKSHAKSNSICEIGGGSNNLSSFLFSHFKNYTVLDLYQPELQEKYIHYITANCESFSDYAEDTLVLSHTFEHLYSPRKFLEAISKSNVKHVFVSVPNMKLWLEKHISSFIVFNQHTFYFEKEDVLALFSQYGFRCKNSTLFADHSLFFCFERDSNTKALDIPIKQNTTRLFSHFHNKLQLKHTLLTQKDVFIMPSFYIGQIAHFFLNHHNIRGFLDNDRNKANKRLYGTPLTTYLPEKVKEHSPESITIFLVKTPYYDEMYEQLKYLQPSVEIIPIEV